MWSRWFAAFALAVLATAPLGAQGVEGVVVHGFGSWGYGRANGRNIYLGGDDKGDFGRATFAANVAASPQKDLRVNAQVEWLTTDEEVDVELDFAFAEYRVSDGLRLRVGMVKQPFGISSEVTDVGTLRPFFSLPQAVYGSVGMQGESYKGIGVTGGLALPRGWGLDYDVYAGGQEIERSTAADELFRPAVMAEGGEFVEVQSTRDVVGGRAVFRTPLSALSFGTSAYTGLHGETDPQRRVVVAGQVEYLDPRWSLRSEIAHEKHASERSTTGYYAEAAYRFTPGWQAAAQYGHLMDRYLDVDVSIAPSLQKHEERALGLNYWLSTALVIKSSVSFIDGNRLASPRPEDLRDAVVEGTLQQRTTMFRFGGQFSF